VNQSEVRIDGRAGAIRPMPSNRYTEAERDLIVETCNSARYASLPPTQIVPALADEDRYIGSESTFYRVLKARGQLNPRGRSKARVKRAAPTTHTAKAPNQVWMMDVTWLPSRVRGRFFYLYMVEDLYSRFAVNWEVFEQENGEHTKSVVEKALWREKCRHAPPVLRSDNGSALKAQTVQQKLLEMGITASHSRPRVSNDNAFVESMFRSLKYCPMWPSQGFETIDDARQWVQQYLQWYTHEHRDSAIKFVTPAQRHTGDDEGILANRRAVYEQARAARPDRWSRHARNWNHEREVSLNPDRSAQLKS
jgi:putative transposase